MRLLVSIAPDKPLGRCGTRRRRHAHHEFGSGRPDDHCFVDYRIAGKRPILADPGT